jgi:hypothetical protein
MEIERFKYQFKHKRYMNKNTKFQKIKEIKKRPVNPFMKYKDVEAVRTDSSVDFNFNNFKELSKKQYVNEKVGKYSTFACALGAPLILGSVLIDKGGPAQNYFAVSNIVFATMGLAGLLNAKNKQKELEKERVYMNEYSDEQKTYLFKKMYDEFEKHLENGKKSIAFLIDASVVAVTTIGISILTQYDSIKTFATGIAIGCCIYAVNKVLEHFGEKKAIKEVENMMHYEE